MNSLKCVRCGSDNIHRRWKRGHGHTLGFCIDCWQNAEELRRARLELREKHYQCQEMLRKRLNKTRLEIVKAEEKRDELKKEIGGFENTKAIKDTESAKRIRYKQYGVMKRIAMAILGIMPDTLESKK